MAGSGKKWAIGCGIGCGLILLIVGGLGTVGYLGIRDLMKRGEKMDSTQEALHDAFGDAKDFAPRADGVIPADRIETFLDVREDLLPDREELNDILAKLSEGEAAYENTGKLAKIKAGIRLVPSIMAYGQRRSEVLLQDGMGLGEYLYIYTLAYYDLLGNDPADGPSFKLTGPDDRDEDGQSGFHWKTEVSNDGDVMAERSTRIRSHLNDLQTALARNQLTAVDDAIAAGETGLAAWREQLAAELARMEDEPRRLLWADGLPEPLRQSLEPYRDRLAAAYMPLVNTVEAGLIDHH